MRFSNTVYIARPVRDVFEYLADFRNIPNWNYAISSAQQSPGPTKVGTTIRQTRTIPTPSEETLEVSGFEPTRRLELRGQLGPFNGVMLYELESSGGGTRLTNSADLKASGLLGLAASLASARVRDAVAQNLAVLKRILESQ